jgi:hypothetical protein
MDYLSDLQRAEVQKGIDMLADLLKYSKESIVSARAMVAYVKKGRKFISNYSPNEIMQINLWERESYKTEAEISEVESRLGLHGKTFCFYSKGLNQWLDSLIEKSLKIVQLVERE